ncbi:glutaredoxin [Thiohalorhabdus denitrificans]|uniref:Glutaredoxin n=1 Tax=Thiohalorhabdus denitrificans TaxID=381306 RepID=A0A0P9GKG3_9GAMM|nr:Grx4 family monothiol glutaredoxin [Thiohalorhabdus denitrificans]KPV40616.1 glutaredoxin [Thiohalorhabdus denitrificans]SCY49495.1 monothiol glutaredoxin [Thiohalorhabdus denitrificans]
MDTAVNEKIEGYVNGHKVVLFMKGTKDFPQCGFSGRAVQILQNLGVDFQDVNVLEDNSVREGIKEYADWPTIPQLYIDGEFVGGSDLMLEMYQNGELETMLK